MDAEICVWGVRGSFPATKKCFAEYGGNTSCISVKYNGNIICLDAGSGLTELIENTKDVRRLDILMSHLHIDHIMGLFYLSAFTGEEIHLYGASYEGQSFEEHVMKIAGSPYWPLDFKDLSAKVYIHEITAGSEFEIPCGATVCTMNGNHPNGSLLYKLRIGSASLTYALDCEMNDEVLKQLSEFAKNTDLLIWDANFTDEDKQPGWGHSTWSEGLALADSAGVKSIMMTHYSRDYEDEFLMGQEEICKQKNPASIFAREGMVIKL